MTRFMRNNQNRKFPILLPIVLITIFFMSSGCMMMGTQVVKNSFRRDVERVKKINTGSVMDQVIDEAVVDLSDNSFTIKSLAVWQIQSKTAGVDAEILRRKLISRLVSLNKFDIIARRQLKKLLAEQSLSLSGSINPENAIQIGYLIGVEGFIDGYVTLVDDRLMLNLNIIDAVTGKIVWSKTMNRLLEPS